MIKLWAHGFACARAPLLVTGPSTRSTTFCGLGTCSQNWLNANFNSVETLLDNIGLEYFFAETISTYSKERLSNYIFPTIPSLLHTTFPALSHKNHHY